MRNNVVFLNNVICIIAFPQIKFVSFVPLTQLVNDTKRYIFFVDDKFDLWRL